MTRLLCSILRFLGFESVQDIPNDDADVNRAIDLNGLVTVDPRLCEQPPHAVGDTDV